MRPDAVDLVLIRAAANGDLTVQDLEFWWRGETVTVSMDARLAALTGDDRNYLKVSDVTTPDGRYLLVPTGAGRSALR